MLAGNPENILLCEGVSHSSGSTETDALQAANMSFGCCISLAVLSFSGLLGLPSQQLSASFK